MKITGIIGFILILLGDLALFFTSMNMPANSKTASEFLIFAVVTVVLAILYFMAALKYNMVLRVVSSIVLMTVPIISFFMTGKGVQQDMHEYGKSLNVDNAFKIFIIIMLLEIIFGVIGLIISIIDGKNTYGNNKINQKSYINYDTIGIIT